LTQATSIVLVTLAWEGSPRRGAPRNARPASRDQRLAVDQPRELL